MREALEKIAATWSMTGVGLILDQVQSIASTVAFIVSTVYTVVLLWKTLRKDKDHVDPSDQ